jgi:hypothetical protein
MGADEARLQAPAVRALGRLAGILALGLSVLAPSASAAGPPLIADSWVTDVTATSANLRAQIDPNGLSTTYRFEYVTQAAYEANLAAIPPREGFFGASKSPPTGAIAIGAQPGPPVTRHVEGLIPSMGYRYRPVATNSAGTTVGPERILATQAPTNVSALPDDRAWELVSPADKDGGAISAPGSLFGGGAFQAAAEGSLLTYSAASAFAGPQSAPPASQYLARRSTTGWSNENLSPPLASATYGDSPDGVPYRLFSESLSAGILFGGNPCRGDLPGCPHPNPVLPGSGAPPGRMAYYLRQGGAYASLLSTADLTHTAVSAEAFSVSPAGASPDLSAVVLSSCAALSADAKEQISAPGECDPEAQNLYRRSGGSLVALNLLPSASETTPGAESAAAVGAVSTDGSRVYWTDTSSGALYLREGASTVRVDTPAGEGAAFQTASADGTIAFFVKEPSPGDRHLYRFSAATKGVMDLTPAGGVIGVLGASSDGAVVYYQDEDGLERWAGGTTSEVAAGKEATTATDHSPASATARVSPSGSHLAFLSKAELSGYDAAGHTELYLYGPPVGGGAPRLLCASCNPTGERPNGSASIPGAQRNGSTVAYRPRVLSVDGQRLFFETSDDLLSADANSRTDVYQWEAQGKGDCARSPGCLSLISGGGGEGATFIDASADGADVFFLTGESLLPNADPGSIDVYDARIGGGLPEPLHPIACVADACQALPSPPEDPTPGTLLPSAGNPAPRIRKLGKGPKKHKAGKEKKKGKGKNKAKSKGKGKSKGSRRGVGR